jgi:hypothetical protein
MTRRKQRRLRRAWNRLRRRRGRHNRLGQPNTSGMVRAMQYAVHSEGYHL